ncbi:hypothetical protein E0H75_22885 [Kribbella capetownensis]|uniref:Uncharacterized protein n=1 Tax=Kribbella capetownensis TaxID=1572659 RepID=A0A4R0JNX5_9ACTN|nr:hypothetical protein [Kribbella capetownensis]TCC47614.1 hypothetical protein E0H75_22885 [Kribbella capetownensis]
MTAEVNDADPPTPRPREVLTANPLRRWIEAGLLLVGGLGLICLVDPTLVLLEYLPQVDPRLDGIGTVSARQPPDIDFRWIINALIFAMLLILVTGLPVRRATGAGSLPGAVAQAIGGLVVCFWALASAALINLAYFGEHCTYAACWPMYEQLAATLVPGLLTALAMIVMANLVNRLAWWIRTLVPVVVWLGTVLIQHAVWTSYLLNLFEGPPR